MTTQCVVCGKEFVKPDFEKMGLSDEVKQELAEAAELARNS